MKRLLMALVALTMVFALVGGALAEALVIAAEPGEASVPEVEVELVAPNDEGDDDGDDEGDDPGDPGEDPEVNVPVDAANFPDDVFRGYISMTYDKNQDGILDEDELDEATKVLVDNSGVTSLKGIEFLYSLTKLSCEGNKGLTAIDVNKNEDLEAFNCKDCGLTSLSVNGCPGLETLNLEGNPLESLNLDGCESVNKLNCAGMSKLASLSLKDCMSVTSIDCTGTALTGLDLSDCESLISLCANDCAKLKAVNLNDTDELVAFAAMNTAITELDLTDNVELKYLLTTGCDIKRIDITDCDGLVKAAKKNAPDCDGASTYFGEKNATYGYPIAIASTTSLVAEEETLYAPKISIDREGPISLMKGNTVQLKAVFEPAALSKLGEVEWSSSDTKVAAVNAKTGVVTGKKKNKKAATITATAPWGGKASVEVTVTAPLVKSLKVLKDKKVVKKLTLQKGKSAQLKVKYSPSDAEDEFTWESSDLTIVSVSKYGKITAKRPSNGKYITITVTAKKSNKRAKVKVKVTN